MQFEKFAETMHGNDKFMNSLSENDRFNLLGLYHQALKGDIDAGDQAGIANAKVSGIYDAWKSKHGMTKEAAMKEYLELVKKLAPETIFPL